MIFSSGPARAGLVRARAFSSEATLDSCEWADWVHHLYDPVTLQLLRPWTVARAVQWTTLQQAMGWPDSGRLQLLAAMRGLPKGWV